MRWTGNERCTGVRWQERAAAYRSSSAHVCPVRGRFRSARSLAGFQRVISIMEVHPTGAHWSHQSALTLEESTTLLPAHRGVQRRASAKLGSLCRSGCNISRFALLLRAGPQSIAARIHADLSLIHASGPDVRTVALDRPWHHFWRLGDRSQSRLLRCPGNWAVHGAGNRPGAVSARAESAMAVLIVKAKSSRWRKSVVHTGVAVGSVC